MKGKMAAAGEALRRGWVDEVQRWAAMKRTGVSLRYMMEFGSRCTEKNLLISAQFLHKQLPARLARRVMDLEGLPFGLCNKQPVLKVKDWYLESFRDLRSFKEIRTMKDELAFTKQIKAIKSRQNHVVPTLALGVQQLKKELDPQVCFFRLGGSKPVSRSVLPLPH